jgi:ankyrin repeat protein
MNPRSIIQLDEVGELKNWIANGADVNMVLSHGRTILWYATHQKSIECVNALIDAKADVNKADSDGSTPLQIASSNGYIECVRLFIQHNVNVNALNRVSCSALHFASLNGHLACMKMLVAAGANVNTPNKDGMYPIRNAILWGHYSHCYEGAEFLLNSGAKMTTVPETVDIPYVMQKIVATHQNVMSVTLTLKGVLKNMRIPKDMVNVMAFYVWNTRADNEWKM